MPIQTFLFTHGPSRSSLVAEALSEQGVSAAAARQRLSRAPRPVRRFPVPMLPKREAFLYLEQERNSDRFWKNFVRDLRASNSIFAAAVDGMAARGGYLPSSQFAVISGAPVRPMRGQIPADAIARRLISANFMKDVTDSNGDHFYELAPSIAYGHEKGWRARDLAERIILDGMREWARKIGLASYNSIFVRGDPGLRAIGPFEFDLAGPSYLLPLQNGPAKPGFLVADVFAEGIFTVDAVQYFIRKARMLKATLKNTGVLSIIVAEGFTGEAITAGHAAGVMMATPKDLFGRRVGAALISLIEVLKNAAAYASSSPDRLTLLLDSLFDIEGPSGNLRGVLFELIAAYLARLDAVSIDMNVKVTDPASGKSREIDVQKVTHKAASVTAIECKAKPPGGELTLAEVEDWLGKIAVIRSYYSGHPHFRESRQSFEIWTSGKIAPDALARLEHEKARRTKSPIDWKDGEAVLEIARAAKEKGISDALYQHFLAHPYAKAAEELAAMREQMRLVGEAALASTALLPTWMT